jgi:hypothetical protein
LRTFTNEEKKMAEKSMIHTESIFPPAIFCAGKHGPLTDGRALLHGLAGMATMQR